MEESNSGGYTTWYHFAFLSGSVGVVESIVMGTLVGYCLICFALRLADISTTICYMTAGPIEYKITHTHVRITTIRYMHIPTC